MKALLVLALCAVLYFELCPAQPLQSLKYRNRREAKNEDTDPELQKLYENMLDEIITLGKNTVTSFRTVFGKVLDEADDDNLEGAEIDEIKTTADAAKTILEKGVTHEDKSLEELFEVFGKSVEIANKYDELENPTDVQKAIKKILDDNNSDLIALKFMTDFITLRSHLDELVNNYIDDLTEAEKEKQTELIDWYAKFKKASGTDNLIDTTMSFFGLFQDDED